MKNAKEVLTNVNNCIDELKAVQSMSIDHFFCGNVNRFRYHVGLYANTMKGAKFSIREVYKELGIFDWWNDTLSMSQLKEMRGFLEKAISIGFTGQVLFKVGAEGCSHGMWAYKNAYEDGHAHESDVLYHSFRSGDCYWDMCLNGVWSSDKYVTKEDCCPELTWKQIKHEIKSLQM